MTADVGAGVPAGLSAGPGTGAREASGAGTVPSTSALLSTCDRLLGEVGRRNHLFAWLKAPGAGAREWLPVDAYYPSHRLTIICRESENGDHELYSELMSAHGLRLLTLSDASLGADPDLAEAALKRKLDELAPPKPAPAPVPRSNPVPQPPSRPARKLGPTQELAAKRAARFVANHRPPPGAVRPAPAQIRRPAPGRRAVARRPVRRRTRGGPSAEAQTIGAVVGLALAVLVGLEAYLGVADVALSSGHILLGFAVALDACARGLGAIAAERAGEHGWAWAGALVGSPVVAGFALFQRSGPVTVEPAPLAGLVALLACVAVGLAALGALLGI